LLPATNALSLNFGRSLRLPGAALIYDLSA